MPGSNPSPVYTNTKNATAYLEIFPVGARVKVQRTDAGRTLNRFWTVWLRKLLLEKPELKDGFSVELGDQSVMITSNLSPKSLVATVQSIASVIVPIPKPPMIRNDSATTKTRMLWIGTDDSSDMSACWETLSLPGNARMSGKWHLILERDQENVFTIGHLGKMVELHAALFYRDRS